MLRSRLGDMGLQRSPGQLAVLGIHRVARISVGDPERGRILFECLGVGPARDVALAGDVGDQRAVVTLIELRPIGIAELVERGKGFLGLAGGLMHPGAGERRSEIGDRPLPCLGKMPVSLFITAFHEGLTAEQEAGDPVGGIVLDQVLGKLDGVVPIG